MVIRNEQIKPFREALYHGRCMKCEEKLNWEAVFDADGTNYHARCCGQHYLMRPWSVQCIVEEDV